MASNLTSLQSRIARFQQTLRWFVFISIGFSASSVPVTETARFRVLREFSNWSSQPDLASSSTTWISPWLDWSYSWNELLLSWNPKGSSRTSGLELQVQLAQSNSASPFYSLGQWSLSTNSFPRRSLKNQTSEWARVETDVFVALQPARVFRIQVIEHSTHPTNGFPLRNLAVSLIHTQVGESTRPADRAAWGMLLPVPELSQHAYPGGQVWCSPTAVTMLLRYWSGVLKAPQLWVDVPETAQAVFDPVYEGTGNWPFNTAYAGTFPGLDAFAIRLRDLRNVERLIEQKIPVAISVSLGLLRERSKEKSDGHIVVVCGLDSQGNVWVNDPDATIPLTQKKPVRRLYPRAAVIRAWASSHQTAYVLTRRGERLDAIEK